MPKIPDSGRLAKRAKEQIKTVQMQTILGANGQIAEELAREIKRNYTSNISALKTANLS